MQVPTYKDSITVGGSSQTKTFTAFPKEMINRQSGQLSLFYYDQYNNDYDMSGLTSLDLKSTPWDSGETPVTLSTGAIGYTPEIITLTASSVPATSGTFTINVNGEVTSALDWNSDNSDILTALEGLASRTAGDFTVNRRNGANLSIAGTEMEIETSGSYSIDYPITIDTSSLDITTGISSDTTQAGSSIQNAFIAEWDKDVIPADYSTYDFDRDGAIVFFVATEDANDFYQAYQRLNIVDDSFSGQQESSSNEATYNYNPADNNAWLRHATSAPTDTGGALDIYARQNFRDFGMVLDQQATPPTSPSDGDAYIVTATATDDWAGYENKIARYSSTLSAWEFSNVHRDWDEVRDDSDSEIYRWNADTSTWDLVGSTGSLAGLDDVTITSEAQGDILYYNGSAWVNLVAGTSGEVLVTQGAGANPIWGASVGTIGDLSDVTMTSEAIGDIIYYNGTAWVNLAAGAAGQFLQTQGNASDPIWGDASATLSGLTDTDITSIANGDILYYDTSDWKNLAVGTSGQVLASTGTGLEWADSNGLGTSLPWDFNTSTTASDPTSGQIKFNNTDPSLVTEIYISTESSSGVNAETLMSVLGNGDSFYVKQVDSSTKYLLASVTSVVDNTGWYTMNVTIPTQTGNVIPDSGGDMGCDFHYTASGGTSGVTTWNGRAAGVVPVAGDYDADQVDFTPAGSLSSTDVQAAIEELDTTVTGLATGVSSVFTRTGDVVATAGDYTSSQVDNSSNVTGTYVTDALNALDTASDPATISAGSDNDQTGTAYTLVLTDEENTTVWMNNASANTVTIPLNSSVAFPIGTKINIMMEDAGTTTIAGDTGVTVNGTSGGAVYINNQYQGATLVKRATDSWVIAGDIT